VSIDWLGCDKEEIKRQIKSYIIQGSTCLDGIYVQYHPSMMDYDSPSSQVIREFSSTYSIGVWNDGKDPDHMYTASKLAELGCSFINTDLPKNFVS
jgi:hypothetical protein